MRRGKEFLTFSGLNFPCEHALRGQREKERKGKVWSRHPQFKAVRAGSSFPLLPFLSPRSANSVQEYCLEVSIIFQCCWGKWEKLCKTFKTNFDKGTQESEKQNRGGVQTRSPLTQAFAVPLLGRI